MASEPATPGTASSPQVQPGSDLTGKSLGEFQVLRRLGKGGMAEVYLAEQTTLQRQVAIKVLRAEFLSDPVYVKRFRHEATAAGGLNHPNIVQVYSIGEQDGVQFIAQEYVRGGNLRDLMKKKGPLDWPLCAFLMRQVAAALQVAGTAGIVHRDIKPENILLTRKGEAKVADFGLAQLTQGGERVALTQVGVTMGTPLYMSPEQVAGKPVDHRSDIYSFGAMAFHMLAGRPPFQGESALAVAVQHLNEKPPQLKDLRPDLPQPICELIHKMMAKKREDRFGDAAALLVDLKLLQKQYTAKELEENEVTQVVAIPVRPAGTSSVIRFDPQSRYAALKLFGTGILVMGAAAGIGWTQRISDPFLTPPPPTSPVPHQSSIEAQFFHAMKSGNDEAAWKAVVDYPADSSGRRDEMERQSAELRLAILYLYQNRWPQAEAIFDRFRLEGVSNPWKKNHGLAGQAVLLSLQGKTAESQQIVAQLNSTDSKLDTKLKALLNEARERNRRPQP